MEPKVLGQNKLRFLDLSQSGRQDFASGPYEYYYYRAGKDETIELKDLGSKTLFVLDVASGIQVAYDNVTSGLQQFDCVQAERTNLKVEATKGAIFIIAGTRNATKSLPAGVSILPEHKLYKVSKPWGYEIWINGSAHPGYCLKKSASIKALKPACNITSSSKKPM